MHTESGIKRKRREHTHTGTHSADEGSGVMTGCPAVSVFVYMMSVCAAEHRVQNQQQIRI